MVPSWTETLLECGLEVVGRTRFCIHPHDRIKAIPRVGGTKDWRLEKVRRLNPDLVVLDEQENPRSMAEAGLPYWASNVRSVADMPRELRSLGALTGGLEELALRWERLPRKRGELPVEWGSKPTGPVTSVVYVIWKDPWMAVGPSTFIGSVLEWLGWPCHPFPESYPTVNLTTLPQGTVLLFSSEPYPFHRKRDGLAELGFPYGFVDGASFSGFGVRTLRLLERRA